MNSISFLCQLNCWIGVRVRNGVIWAVLIFAQINSAGACACCTEVGQRQEAIGEINDIQRDVLNSIRFTSRAELIGNMDDVKGLTELSFEEPIDSFEYVLTSTVEPHLLTFDLSQGGKERGKISFPLPIVMERFEVDTRDTTSSENLLGPALYREWRLTGKATLTGLVTKGAHAAYIRLILQGRGNSCPNEQDFSHWSLTAEGEGIYFELIGEMQRYE